MLTTSPQKNAPHPSYRLHKATGQAIVTLSGRDVYLGKYGSPESRVRYDQELAEWLANGRRPPTPAHVTRPLSEVLAAYLVHAEDYYHGRDGDPTRELEHVKHVIRHLRETFPAFAAEEFGPLQLKIVRQRLVDAGQCRRFVNQNVQRIKRLFKWAASEGLIPAIVPHGLECVEGLRYGRTAARESEPVRPVPIEYVNMVVARVSAEIGAMIRLQLATGMRSGELVTMRTGNIDMTGKVWRYTPEHHKTEHHGHERIVWLGPKAQRILKPRLRTNLTEYIFSPRRATADRYAACKTHRHQPVKRPKTKRRIGQCYSVNTYRQAIRDAIDAINSEIRAQNVETGGQVPEIPAWFPHQLRHNAATEIRRQYNIEAARAVLGQRTITAAAIYAEQDAAVARSVAAKIG